MKVEIPGAGAAASSPFSSPCGQEEKPVLGKGKENRNCLTSNI